MTQETRRIGVLCALVLIATLIPREACAQVVADSGSDWYTTDPLWEIGVMVGAVSLPAYKGSDESNEYVLPFPYLVYRGEKLSVDDESLTGSLFNSERLEVATSVFFDVNSNDDAREDMEELDPLMFAVGPALKLYFVRAANAGYDLYVDLPLRAAISANSDSGIDMTYRGMQTKINLCYENRRLFGLRRLDFLTCCGVSFYDSDLASYYYEVDDGDVTDTRPGYEADGGFAGATASVDMLYRLTPRVAVRLYGRAESVHGTAFEDSPLVSDKVSTSAGLAVYVRLLQSFTRVERE